MRYGMYGAFLLGVTLLLTACSNPQKEVFQEAEQDLVKGHYESALEGFREAIDSETKTAYACRGEGVALLKLNRYEEAIEALKRALNQDENNKKFQKDVLSYKATAEYKAGKLEEALLTCGQLEDLGMDGDSYLLMGKIQLELAQYTEAEASFGKALEEDDSYETYIGINQSYAQKDMTADGEAYLKQALETPGKDQEDYYQRGRIYFFMGDKENARDQLIKASNEGHEEAQLFLGKVYLSSEETANARVIYQQYMKSYENSARGYNGLALCDIAEGDYKSALTNLQKGLEAAETDEVQELLYNEAVVYEKMLDFTTAKTKMAAYLELYPEDEAAQKEYEFLLYR